MEEITDKIYDKLLESDINNVTKAFCEVSTGNVKILVVAKADNELDESGNLKTKFKHVQNLNDRVKSYDELPDYILDEFTKMTSGLVSNVALKSITSLRNNTYKILSIYNKEIDPAFLSHRALLPTLDDAGDLLKQSLVDSFSSILDYDNVIAHCSYTPIKLWLQSNEFSEKEIKVKKQAIRIRKSNLKIWQNEGFKLAINKAWVKQLPNIEVNEKNIADEFKNQKDVTLYFTPDNFIPKDTNEKFSILTHHKSNYATASYKPKLSLGTIIRGVKSGQFWFCLQQKCDSVRLGSESRRFLFLPLNLNENKFNFLIKSGDNYIKLKVNYDTHSIRTIRFLATEEQMVVARRFGKGLKYYFIPEYYKKHKKYDKDNDQLFEWVMDLKDAHAQRVANLYASQLSRVGLDESEWLRKWSST
ncbi:hypothetical protein [Daejeonella sp.]|uniref:hypothetical protein n=1 Tax=Daejeonella sp. TaxID=2805397 RepID=UPI0027305A5B|nr:hypothetical protein [Daejeonella sp.]MDP2415854.1 hypothetical protein [Daejeonella sp.]